MKTPKILIVEDDIISSKLYNFYFKNYDVQILNAYDGAEGLEVVKNNSDIDLVLMNYMMPKMNGITATSKIREFNKDVIIILTSAAIVSASDLQKKSTDVGCNDYLSLPFRLTELIQKIEHYLNYELIKK